MLPWILSNAVVVMMLLTFSASPTMAGICRKGLEAQTSHCALPLELGNFQGYYTCNTAVKVGRPSNVSELQQLVAHYPRVKASGIGHSWWGRQFCSGNDSQSINIVMTELNTTVNLIEKLRYFNASNPAPKDWPIQVNESSLKVSAAAGVPLRLLLDSLANFTSPQAPKGYTLQAFSFYIDQTIGGAVSTGTHGSSFQHGSLSSQVTRLDIVLANGTLASFTNTSTPFLWDAVRISVGRLGVITEVELQIVPMDTFVREVTYTNTAAQLLSPLVELSNAYKQGLQSNNEALMASTLAKWEATQIFYYPLSNQSIWVNYTSLEAAAQIALEPMAGAQVSVASIGNSLQNTIGSDPASVVTSMPQSNLAPGPYLSSAFAQVPSPALGKQALPAGDPIVVATNYNALQYSFIASSFLPGNFTRRDSIISETAAITITSAETDAYDQYEFSIALERVGDCMTEVIQAIQKDYLGYGMLGPSLIRFVGSEKPLLSNAHGGPRLFWNIEDHQSYQTGYPNAKFDEVVRILRGPTCKSHMHWGKAGWEKWANCFDGASEYPTSWCQFGCAVQTLDPNGKFRSQSDVWVWNATLNGAAVPFQQCCGTSGFSAQCQCASRTDCTYTPPPIAIQG